MKYFKLAIMGLALGSSVSFAADCVKPDAPTIPSGASASMEDMLNGQKAVKTFQTTNMDYMKCLEEKFTAAEAAALEGSDEEKEAAKSTYDTAIEAYNTAVSKEEEVAGKFNTEIRAYKAANPS